MTNELIKVFSYLRVSGKGQVDGDGYERQLLACQEYARTNGYEIARVFQEEGISGKTELSNRPALSDMLSLMEETGITVILIERLDRLARDLMVSETIIADLAKSGYTLLSTCEPDLCSDDPSRKLVRQIFSAIAEYDRSMIVLKLRGARQRIKEKKGKCEGRLPYGTKHGEEQILYEMKVARRHGMTFDAIAKMMNDSHTPTRMGKPWKGSTIAKILKRS